MLNSWPHFTEEEINAVSHVLKKGNVNYWTGNYVQSFESAFSIYCGAKYAVAHANGTLALENSYRALCLPKFSEVITTPRSFVATSSALISSNLKPVFADVDLNSGNITAKSIEPLISKTTSAISVVHLAGWPADMVQILALARSYNLKVVEDCSQAHGAYIQNIDDVLKPVGSFGDISAWSFCQDKIISTGGEGGMVCTSNDEIYTRVWSFKDHGKNKSKITPNMSPSFHYIHDSIGSNYRMTSMQAVIGEIQLNRLSPTSERRRKLYQRWYEALQSFNCLRNPCLPPNIIHACYKFYTYVYPSRLKDGWTRDAIINAIRQKGYPAFSGSCSEIYQESCMKGYVNPDTFCSNSVQLGATSIMLLVHPTISDDQMASYINAVTSVILTAQK